MRSLILFLFATSAFPQIISYGVKGGVPFTDALNAITSGNISYTSLTHRYTIGPTVELHLPFHLGVEFDVLYNRLDFNSTESLTSATQLSATTANSWEFPLLLKYRFGHGPIHPYVAGGPSFRGLSGVEQILNVLPIPHGTATTSSTSNPSQLQNNFVAGFAFGGGVDVHALFLHISPEIRFTRWTSQNFTDNVTGALNTNLNEAAFLVGFTF
jgi:hypothetical protein